MRSARVAWLAAGWCLLQGLVVAADSSADQVLGVWLTEGRDSKVEISRLGDTYSGKVVWLAEPERDGMPVRDAGNANAALRDRPIIGLDILTGFVREAGGHWRGGRIYSPRQGKSYPADLAITGDDRLQITVRAGMFSKEVVWAREEASKP